MQKVSIAGLLILLLLASCKKDSDETQIRNRINEMALAIEAKNGREFVNYLDEQFQDQDGRTRKKIRAMLAVIFLQNKTIKVNYQIDALKLVDNTAQVSIHVTSSDGYLVGFRASRVSIQSLWKKTNGEWALYRARWARTD
ncbi:MAG: hypothetical protein ACC635_01940 [Acidiferrobacterales bacterium]